MDFIICGLFVSCACYGDSSFGAMALVLGLKSGVAQGWRKSDILNRRNQRQPEQGPRTISKMQQ
jgi:hypothetical protein